MVSGKDIDKLARVQFTKLKSAKVLPPILKECPYNMECKVVKEMELNQWQLIFGEILETHIDAKALDKEKGTINMVELNPIIYCSVVKEYWTIGQKLGCVSESGIEFGL